jgi:hypothetical protein
MWKWLIEPKGHLHFSVNVEDGRVNYRIPFEAPKAGAGCDARYSPNPVKCTIRELNAGYADLDPRIKRAYDKWRKNFKGYDQLLARVCASSAP